MFERSWVWIPTKDTFFLSHSLGSLGSLKHCYMCRNPVNGMVNIEGRLAHKTQLHALERNESLSTDWDQCLSKNHEWIIKFIRDCVSTNFNLVLTENEDLIEGTGWGEVALWCEAMEWWWREMRLDFRTSELILANVWKQLIHWKHWKHWNANCEMRLYEKQINS